MRALTYHGTKDVRVETVPDPVLQNVDDVILRVTATAICGSDLHLYRGKIPELKRVVVAYENKIAMEETLEQGLKRIFGGGVRPQGAARSTR